MHELERRGGPERSRGPQSAGPQSDSGSQRQVAPSAGGAKPAAGPSTFAEKPQTPRLGWHGTPIKSVTRAIVERRTTRQFAPDAIPDELLRSVLAFAAQAPSSFNLQPWRFIIVRDAESRVCLSRAAHNQEEIMQAPVLVLACGMKEEIEHYARAVMAEGARRGAEPADVDERLRHALDALAMIPAEVWVNRQTMVAVSFMLLAAEALGIDSAVFETVDSKAVRARFDLPDEAEIVALVALGRRKSAPRPYPGRLALERVAFRERYGQALMLPTAANTDAPQVEPKEDESDSEYYEE